MTAAAAVEAGSAVVAGALETETAVAAERGLEQSA